MKLETLREKNDWPFHSTREELLKKSKQELVNLILIQNDLQIPVSIFNNNGGPLECLVKYLKEEKKIPIKEISIRLNRNVQTIWTTYRNAGKNRFVFSNQGLKVPLGIFSKQDKSIMESLIQFLNTTKALQFSQISRLLNKDLREIWTYHARFVMKEQNQNRSIGGKKDEK